MHAILEYIESLRSAPAPIERREKWLLAALFIVVAASRFLARSASQLDWDESLFSCAVRQYDVVPHNPHPPGYPLFILFAKIARFFVHDDFLALRTVSTIASILLFPAAFFLARELRLRFRVSLIAATLTVFMPTVWYYGGTALSDVPALSAVVIASALLLAGGRNRRAWIAGMAVLGIAGGIRPQHVIIGGVAALLGAAALRERRTLIRGSAVFAAIVAASYIGAAFASSKPPFGYLEQVGVITHHIGSTDSFRNPGRPPLSSLARMFFIDSHRGGAAGHFILFLAAIAVVEALVRRRVAVWTIAAMFIPTAVMSWMMLDTTAVTRYGIAYVMLFSFLAACGIEVVAHVRETDLAQSAVAGAGAAVLIVVLIGWTLPGLAEARSHASPPVAAMRWIRMNVPKDGPQLYLDDSMGYHALYQLPGYQKIYWGRMAQIPASAYRAGNYCVTDKRTMQPHARVYRFTRGRLYEIARQSYFDVSVIPMESMIRFGPGWHQDEFDDKTEWRWMGRTSLATLPPLPVDGVLHLRFRVPLDSIGKAPVMTVRWNGSVIEQSACGTGEIDRRYLLRSVQPANELKIELDRAARPADRGLTSDKREFGLQLTAISWERSDGVPWGG